MNNHKPDIRKSNPCPPCPASATWFEKSIYWLGIGLGSGLPKRAAGTWGTLGGVIIALPLILLGFWGFLVITVFACVIGSYICGKTSDLMNVHDDPHIVFDEWVGMWIALLPSVAVFEDVYRHHMQFVSPLMPYLMIIIPFILFRFFDIVKPFPIKWVDKNVSGGFGILIDDILAGMMAMICCLLIGYYVIMVYYLP